MRKFCIALSLALVGLASPPGWRGLAQAPSGSTPAVTEEVFAEKDAAAALDDDQDMVSTDGRHAAWRTGPEKKRAVMLDGQRQGGEFDEVKFLAFSGDGRHLAFAGRRGKTWMMVLDGQEPKQVFEKISEPLFSPDGARLAFFGKRQGKWNIVLDGEALGAPLDDYDDAVFSADGQRLAYVGSRRGKYVVVVDLKEDPPFGVIGGLRFSGDGRRFGYAAAEIKTGFGSDKGVGRVVIDGEVGPSFEGEKASSLMQSLAEGATSLTPGYFADLVHRVHGVSAPVFSADGTHVAYVAHRGKEDEVVMVDGQPGPKFTAISAGPRFCADGKHVAYSGRRAKDDEVVVVDGQAGPRFASIVGGPQFCNAGKHIAYVASDAGSKFLVVDGERVGNALLPGADFVSDLAFAPDGHRVGYVAITGSLWAGPGRNLATGSSFSKGIGKTAKRRVYLDAQPGTEYDARTISGLDFSADSRHAVYVVHGVQEGSRRVSFVVANRTEAKRYDAVWTRTLTIQDTSTIVYVAQSGRKFIRVTQPLQ